MTSIMLARSTSDEAAPERPESDAYASTVRTDRSDGQSAPDHGFGCRRKDPVVWRPGLSAGEEIVDDVGGAVAVLAGGHEAGDIGHVVPGGHQRQLDLAIGLHLGRALIDRAVAASGTDLTDFVISNLTVASRRVLADRTEFILGSDAREAWEEINRRRARSLTGLRGLMARPSPFTDE